MIWVLIYNRSMIETGYRGFTGVYRLPTCLECDGNVGTIILSQQDANKLDRPNLYAQPYVSNIPLESWDEDLNWAPVKLNVCVCSSMDNCDGCAVWIMILRVGIWQRSRHGTRSTSSATSGTIVSASRPRPGLTPAIR